MRFVKFNTVGALGIVVQLAVIWLLTESVSLPVELATAIGVSAAIANNFYWHQRWTWADRGGVSTLARFGSFVLGNGMVSLVGNVVLMSVLAETTTLRPVLANVIAISVCGFVNYWVGDLVVFRAES